MNKQDWIEKRDYIEARIRECENDLLYYCSMLDDHYLEQLEEEKYDSE